MALDHDARRREIADVVVEVIAREGLEAATIRRIAAEVGVSTTAITHYFADKDEMLLWAYRTLGDWAHDHFEEAVARDPADLTGYLMSMTAAGTENLAFWRTYIAIWDKSLRDPVLAAERDSWIDNALARIASFALVVKPDCADPAAVAKHMLAMVQGISVQILFKPDSWTAESVRAALAVEIEQVLARDT